MQTFYMCFNAVACVWAAVVVGKVVAVRRRGENYRFEHWDGGLMAAGKALGPRGTWAFGVFAVAVIVVAGGATLVLAALP